MGHSSSTSFTIPFVLYGLCTCPVVTASQWWRRTLESITVSSWNNQTLDIYRGLVLRKLLSTNQDTTNKESKGPSSRFTLLGNEWLLWPCRSICSKLLLTRIWSHCLPHVSLETQTSVAHSSWSKVSYRGVMQAGYLKISGHLPVTVPWDREAVAR